MPAAPPDIYCVAARRHATVLLAALACWLVAVPSRARSGQISKRLWIGSGRTMPTDSLPAMYRLRTSIEGIVPIFKF